MVLLFLLYHYTYMNKVRKRIYQTMNSWINVGGGKKGRTDLYVSVLFEVLGLLFSTSEFRKKERLHIWKEKQSSVPLLQRKHGLPSPRGFTLWNQTPLSWLILSVFMEFFSPLVNVYWVTTICRASSFIPSWGFLFSLRIRTYYLIRYTTMKIKRLSVKWPV